MLLEVSLCRVWVRSHHKDTSSIKVLELRIPRLWSINSIHYNCNSKVLFFLVDEWVEEIRSNSATWILQKGWIIHCVMWNWVSSAVNHEEVQCLCCKVLHSINKLGDQRIINEINFTICPLCKFGNFYCRIIRSIIVICIFIDKSFKYSY